MPDRLVEIDGNLRRVTFPEDTPITERLGLVWQGRFVNEVSGRALRAPVRVRSKPELSATTSENSGQAGLVAVPAQAFPDLGAAPVPLEIRAEAEGYLDVDLTDQVVAHPNHPDDFTPAQPAQPIEMQPRPSRLSGQVRRRGAGGLAPVVGATVEITGYWTFDQQGNVVPPVDPAEVVEVRPAVTTATPAATTVRRINLNAPGTDTRLAVSAQRGSREVMLENRAGLNVGHILAFEPTHPDRQELVRIDAISAFPPAPFRGTVTLGQPLSYNHAANTEVSRRTVTVAGPVRSLTRDVIPGGVSLFVNNPNGLDLSGFLRIGPAATAQFRRVRRYITQTDAAGNFVLPPIHRIARVFIEVRDAISTVSDIPWIPRNTNFGDRLDIELPP